MSLPNVFAALSELYAAESTRIRLGFESNGDGKSACLARTDVVDTIVRALYQAHISAEISGPDNFCLVALGGYGRRELFPHSDVDLLFLSDEGRLPTFLAGGAAAVARELWDLGLRVSNTSRRLAECGQLHQDNLEFSVSLLDCRPVAGDARLFSRLRERVLPHLVGRDRADLVRRLVQMTEDRHERFGNTIFHLEPHLKDAPGGLRDYHVARWLAMIFELDESARWTPPEKHWPAALGSATASAFDFLAASRAFLHLRRERDDNLLTYELQDEAAAAGVGVHPPGRLPAEAWMRHFFRHARSVDRLLTTLLEEADPPRGSLYGLFQDWRSRLSTPEFAVVRERIYLRQPAEALKDPVTLLSMFEFSARHGLGLSREAERRVMEVLPQLDEKTVPSQSFWIGFRAVLVAPHASKALRAMHRLGLLDAFFPEFRAIDSLVVRDFYHRYTVDAHSLLTLENLDRLRQPSGRPAPRTWEGKFSEILGELEQPELLYLALLFHDVGKGLVPDNHVRGSLDAVEAVFSRLGLNPVDCETIRFLIQDHLIMSATLLRRDIFDPDTVREFADRVGTPERLKMLCLLTYADVKSVNPEALTPWKAEMLWQLYAASTNYLTRSLDERRVHAGREEEAVIARVQKELARPAGASELAAFVEGFPRRYLLTHTPQEIASHFRMHQCLAQYPVQVEVHSRSHFFELTVLTHDRPFLFASITGALAGWGMNILKADAFANAEGTALDTFRFADLHRTLELNPTEHDRFKKSITDVLAGRVRLEDLLRGRTQGQAPPRPKVRVPTRLRFEDAPASRGEATKGTRSTVLEIITHDRPGVLYQISSTLAELGLNIEIALIDTEGEKVIDVFYLTLTGAPLSTNFQATVRDALLQKLA